MIKIKFGIILCFMICSCSNHVEHKENAAIVKQIDTFNCSKGEMSMSISIYGCVQNIPNKYNNVIGLKIIIDTKDSSLGFKSEWDANDDKIGNQFCGMNRYLKLLTIHETDKRQQIVWIINNDKDTFTFQISDYMADAVLQAQTRKNNWNQIQFWEIPNCGNSNGLIDIPPQKAIPVLIFLPKGVNYSTKLRLKLLGVDQFYYSNEFDWTINECAFVEDKATYTDRFGDSMTHYSIDSILAWSIKSKELGLYIR